MTTQANATGERFAGGESATCERPELLTVTQVGRLLNCSPRHVYRLADCGKLPRPIRLGHLIRWSRTSIAAWVNAGCPTVGKGGRQ